jgi:hypothetical protein
MAIEKPRRRCASIAVASLAAFGLQDFEHDALRRQAVEAHQLGEIAPAIGIVRKRGRVDVEIQAALPAVEARVAAQVQRAAGPVEAHAAWAAHGLEELSCMHRFATARERAHQRFIARGRATLDAVDRLEDRGERDAFEREPAAGVHDLPRHVAERRVPRPRVAR